MEIAARHPEYLLTGAALRDQGEVVTRLLAHGWQPGHLERVITGRPLPERTRSVGAVVARRLRDAAAGPVPPADAPRVRQGERSTTAAADRSVAEALAAPVDVPECPQCGRPLVAGQEVCRECRTQQAAAAADTPDTCPGWDGAGCGRPAVAAGLCARCRIRAGAVVAV